MKQQTDICFLKEMYSTKEIENSWKLQWKGEMPFTHGSEHRGFLILVNDSLEFQVKSMRQDSQGCFILLETIVQTSEQILFFETNRVHIDDECTM